MTQNATLTPSLQAFPALIPRPTYAEKKFECISIFAEDVSQKKVTVHAQNVSHSSENKGGSTQKVIGIVYRQSISYYY